MKKRKAPTILTRGMQARLVKMHLHFLNQFRDPNPGRRYSNATQLGKLVHTSPRTIYRMIEIMQDDFELPVEPIRERGGYGYTEEVTSFPASNSVRPNSSRSSHH
jgi:hypothetical protein